MSRSEADFGPDLVHHAHRDPGLLRGRTRIRRGAFRLNRKANLRLVDDVPSTTARDVICAGMYRACSTWQYEVVGQLVEKRLHGQRLGYVSGDCYESPARSRSGRGPDGPGRCWRVLKSHEGHASFSHAIHSGHAIAVYVLRDVRDVIDSLMFKRHSTFDRLLRQGMIHQILANDRFWRSQPGVLVQRYEELIDDPATAVVQLARHLGLGVTRREATEIADDFSLESNGRRIESLRRRLAEAGIDLEQSTGLQICDPVTLLHWNHLRPTRSSSWQTQVSPRERAMLERLCGDWLGANGYERTTRRTRRDRGFWPAPVSSLRGSCDLALGRAAVSLRWAAARFPLAAKLVKRLLGMTGSGPDDVVLWPASDPKIAPRVLSGSCVTKTRTRPVPCLSHRAQPASHPGGTGWTRPPATTDAHSSRWRAQRPPGLPA